ncbi:MAG: hypothetical protein SH821_13860 [Phototrophicales bacterium]|nr:hypothetical protein [Phototrophicales bacterium]
MRLLTHFFLMGMMIVVLCACEGQATPFPAQIATATPDSASIAQTPIPSTPEAPLIRYAIDPSLANIPIQLEGNYQIINATAPIFASDVGVAYDIAIGFAGAEGWQASPIPVSIGLLLHPTADFSDILWRATDPPAFIEQLGINEITPLHDSTTPMSILRTDMANLGKPDGFTVNMGIIGIIGEDVLRRQLGALFIETQTVNLSTSTSTEERLTAWQSGEIDLMLVSWFTDAEKAEWVALVGEANLLPLFSVPIGYITRPDLAISLSAQGLPQVIVES